MFDQSLNQWVVEDMIAHDIVEGVLESIPLLFLVLILLAFLVQKYKY